MVVRGVVLLVLAGCGRLGFDTVDASDDASTGDATDAPTFGSFGPPVEVVALTGPTDHDYGPSVGAGDLEIVFTTSRVGGFTVWTASRTAPTDVFAAPMQIAVVDVAGGIEFDPELSTDALELLFAASGPPSGIHRMTRASRASTWTGTPVFVTELANREGPSLMLGDLRLLVSRINGGIEEYERATLGAPWSLIRSHTTLAEMQYPGVREDGLELYCVDRTQNQLFRAERASIDDQFGTPVRVLLGAGFDARAIVDPELAAAARTLYLSIENGAKHDIFTTTR